MTTIIEEEINDDVGNNVMPRSLIDQVINGSQNENLIHTTDTLKIWAVLKNIILIIIIIIIVYLIYKITYKYLFPRQVISLDTFKNLGFDNIKGVEVTTSAIYPYQ